MRDDGDFTAYVEARWPALVRCLVLLGSPVDEAVEVAERALARCWLDWRAIRTAEDIDVEVYSVLLAQRTRIEEAAPAVAEPAGASRGRGPFSKPGPVVTARPIDAVLLLDALLAALDRLRPDVRSAVVLRHAAGLSIMQVAEVLRVDPLEVEERDSAAIAELDPEGLVRQCR